MRVAVTGAAGRLGQALIPALTAAEGIERVTAIDRCPIVAGERTNSLQMDLADLAPEHLEGHDSLIHLAFQLMGGQGGRRRRDRHWVRTQNVELSRQVFHAAAAAGLRQIVFLSSAAVYGPWPDSPRPLTERSPARPRFPYAEDKVATEQALLAVGAQYPDLTTCILRPPAIVGPHAHPLLRRVARSCVYPGGVEVPVQILWEDDAADAVVRAVTRQAEGIFNLGAEPVWSMRRMALHGRRWGIPVPPGLIRALHPLAWRLTRHAGDPGWVQGLDGALQMDCSRAREQLGWTPRVSTPECLERLRR